MTREKKSKLTTWRLRPSQHQRLKAYCAQTKSTMARFCRRAIDDELDRCGAPKRIREEART